MPPTTSTSEPGQYATREEAHDAIDQLQESGFVKLMVIARSFTKTRLKGDIVEAGDLVREAIAKTLEGRRRWNRSVSIVRHLDRVMESDSGHLAERQVREQMQPLDVQPEIVARDPSPESRLLTREALNHALALFADDERALRLIHLKGEDYSASEIRAKLGMSKVEYDTVTKRIRRRLANSSLE